MFASCSKILYHPIEVTNVAVFATIIVTHSNKKTLPSSYYRDVNVFNHFFNVALVASHSSRDKQNTPLNLHIYLFEITLHFIFVRQKNNC